MKADGTVVATGWDGTDNFYITENACRTENWTDIVAIAAGTGYTVGLKSDGTVISVGYNDNNKQKGVLEWEGIKIYEEWK